MLHRRVIAEASLSFATPPLPAARLGTKVRERAHALHEARKLHLAQSALSQQIRRLEAELGIQVLRRTSRSVDVTPEGSVVLAYARRVLTEVDGLQAELEELTGVVRGRVAIGAMWPTGNYDLAGTLATFHRRHAGVEIHMVEETADRLLEIIERRCVDGINGASWQAAAFHKLYDRLDRADALREMTVRYRDHMHSNEPVHTWPLPT